VTLLTRSGATELAQVALDVARKAGADQAEVVIMTENAGLTRYAHNRVHQHVAGQNAEVRVRAVVEGDRVAVATGNQLTNEGLITVAGRAVSMAKCSPHDADFPGLPSPPGGSYVDQTTFYESTARIGPNERAETVKEIVTLLAGAGADGYGAVTSGATELVVANSEGVHAYQPFTDAWLSVIAERPRSDGTLPATGYASSSHRDWTEIDAESAALHALAKADPDPPREISPGRYTVVLEEEAVADMLAFLGATALNGLDYLEGRSPYTGRLGQRPYPATITLRDDPTDARGANLSFDFEGVPKAPLTLIREGALEQVVFDTAAAYRAHERSTGHALPAPNPHGPVPLNLVLNPGHTGRHELLAGIEHGLLITRFHYTNEVDPARTLLTGTTRDGTFLVERGEVVAPVGNLRWVQSVEETLKGTLAVGDTPKLISEGPGYGIRFFTGVIAPALLVEGFQITGGATG
jgi:PmbA protein